MKQMPSLQEVKEKLNSYVILYSEIIRGGSLEVVFFKDAITHLIKVSLANYSKFDRFVTKKGCEILMDIFRFNIILSHRIALLV